MVLRISLCLGFMSMFFLIQAQSPGDFDTSFGDNGKVVMGFGYKMYSGSDFVAQADGKILVVGPMRKGLKTGFAMARFTPSMELDSTYGQNGYIYTQLGDRAIPKMIGLQSDGKVIVAGNMGDDEHRKWLFVRYFPTGIVDSTFGENGVRISSFGINSVLNDMVILPDDRIIAAGHYNDYWTKHKVVLAKFDADGTKDLAFGEDGRVIKSILGYSNSLCQSMAVKEDGNIVFIGKVFELNQDPKGFVAQVDSFGQMDLQFANQGVLTLFEPWVKTITIDMSQRILLGGGSYTSFFLGRLNANGWFDTSFGSDGIVAIELALPKKRAIQGITVSPTGKIFAVGWEQNNYSFSSRHQAILTVNDSGVLDSLFGVKYWPIYSIGNHILLDSVGSPITLGEELSYGMILATYDSVGIVKQQFSWHFGTSQEAAESIDIQEDNRIVIGGEGTLSKFSLSRIESDGSLDLTFGENGIRNLDFGDTINVVSVKITSDQKIIALGACSKSSVMVRLMQDGQVDTSFGSNGIEWIPNLEMSFMKISPNEKITLASGRLSDSLVLIRYDKDGHLDESFGLSGYANISFPSSSNFYKSRYISYTPDGSILVSGKSDIGKTRYFLTRLSSTGLLDTTFGNSGVVHGSYWWDDNELVFAKALPNGKIIGGGIENENFLMVRFLPNGALDTSFADEGKATIQVPDCGYWGRMSVVQDDSGKLNFSHTSNESSKQYIVIARFNADGTLDGDFGEGLIKKVISDNGDLVTNALLIQPSDQKIVCAGKMYYHGYLYFLTRLYAKEVVDIDEVKQNNSFLLFPNPAMEQVMLSLGRHSHQTNYRVIDAMGRVRLSGKISPGSTKIALDISNLPKGIYFVKVGQLTNTQQFVKTE
ncbi:MAG TPA: T9SS type A sorting domain-containing protein [Saprospiraceae bacterium]|nr:T9SS type A sorting domain-containing protein [Saprospiraceae bacterium]